ncbi:MAG TPA: AAA family ATPase [Pseudonocardiaceae bacterium]|nr:AAA family ATPase [Pseudonocardiaceae bacterium]
MVGPRASGKTTTAARHARTVIRLDEPRQAVVVEADPDAALRDRAEPVLIDEWQLVPLVLGAVKRAVDAVPRPGRFIVTGSVRGRLDSPTWPGTGRRRRPASPGRASRPARLPRTGAQGWLSRRARADRNALNTAGVVPLATLHEVAEIDRKTAEAYEGLLRDLSVIDTVPAWSTNRLKRLVRSPRRYLVDPGSSLVRCSSRLMLSCGTATCSAGCSIPSCLGSSALTCSWASRSLGCTTCETATASMRSI